MPPKKATTKAKPRAGAKPATRAKPKVKRRAPVRATVVKVKRVADYAREAQQLGIPLTRDGARRTLPQLKNAIAHQKRKLAGKA